MADALRADIEGCPDALWPHGLASMGRQAQAGILGFLEQLAEGLGAGTPLISSNPDANDAARVTPQFCCFAKDASRLFPAKMTACVEDPVQRDPEFAIR